MLFFVSKNPTSDCGAKKIGMCFCLKFKNKNIILVGNSMGGQIALNYAYHYKIDALILIDPMGIKVKESFVDKLGKKRLKDRYLKIFNIEKMEKIIAIGLKIKI